MPLLYFLEIYFYLFKKAKQFSRKGAKKIPRKAAKKKHDTGKGYYLTH